MMRNMLVAALLVLVHAAADASVNVFACEPEWAALVTEVAGDQVTVTSATTAQQDPHRIQARPSLIARMRRADLVICTGAELEAGWLPLLLRRANNPRVQPGQPGYLEAASVVSLLERPQRLDRADGDVHAAGNPHIQTNPHHLASVAREIADRLAVIDPDRAAAYRDGLEQFLARWQTAIARWEQAATALRGMRVVAQHNSWVYLNDWLGLQQVATIESKPGVPPSGGHLSTLVAQLGQQPAAAIIRAAYQHDASAAWLSERTAIPVVVLPYTVGGSDDAADLFGLFDATLERLLAVAP